MLYVFTVKNQGYYNKEHKNPHEQEVQFQIGKENFRGPLQFEMANKCHQERACFEGQLLIIKNMEGDNEEENMV